MAVIHLSEGTPILQMLQEHQPQFLGLDYDLPGLNGIEIYDLVHRPPGWADLPAIMVSASLSEQAIRYRNIPGLHKPCSRDELLRAIEQAMK
ncbi:response regulator [Ktedonobacter sp. SOSP1-85]|uniref:response regulator n=1 Tax=Ktedonobacter sp. SOSP1-85 TaxID=2778367 RepID=UPI0021035A16|nr:response regulator [Ktedonobacter sp. SOSP1-85]